jgi:hypothetical protein
MAKPAMLRVSALFSVVVGGVFLPREAIPRELDKFLHHTPIISADQLTTA